MASGQPNKLEGGGGLRYWPSCWAPPEANRVFAKLRASVPWEQGTVKLFGRQIDEPRLSVWFGDPEASYRYSGVTRKPVPFSEQILQIKRSVEASSGHSFNSCLANLYRHGRDSMGWHADDEAELGPSPVIASVSFGEPRRFRLKQRDGLGRESLVLAHGSLLVMEAGTQAHWKHSIAKTSKEIGERINLTFRFFHPLG